jgi:hypothetical protein
MGVADARRVLIRISKPVRSWYQAKRAKDDGKGGKALVAIMRRLGLALYPAARGVAFDVNRLVGGRGPAVVKGRPQR